jgi:hypothetical protein
MGKHGTAVIFSMALLLVGGTWRLVSDRPATREPSEGPTGKTVIAQSVVEPYRAVIRGRLLKVQGDVEPRGASVAGSDNSRRPRSA